MLDHSGKKRSERIDGIGDYPKVGLSSPGLKSCESCRTTKTPLWRGGPSGPKSLCNACGIKYRKKRREMVGLSEGEREEKKVKGWKSGVVGLLGIGPRRRRRLAEEEEAAFLLMALSSGLQSPLCVV